MQPAAGEMQLQVIGRRREADDVLSLRLADPAGAPLPAFTPGAHIALRLGVSLVRQYSLCNGPDDGSAYSIAVKREAQSRGGSAAVHCLAEGDLVTATSPVNAFAVDWSAPHLVLLAGGIGITVQAGQLTPSAIGALFAQQCFHEFFQCDRLLASPRLAKQLMDTFLVGFRAGCSQPSPRALDA